MRAIGYFRESPQRQASLAQQNKAFLEYCDREGFEVAGTFVDSAGSNGHAPGFRELVKFVRAGSADVVVVVPTFGGLGANARDAALHYFQLEGLGVRVAAIAGPDDASAEIVTAWSSEDAASLSNRVRAAMRRKAVKGEVLGRPPYGYKVGARRRLELIPEEAVVVRYIFRLYLQEAMGIRLIARRLNQEGLKTRRGGNWSMVSIRDILRNRVYLGTYSRFGVKVPGSHTSLVSADDFRVVQDRLSARRTSHSPRVTSQFLLSGIARCAYCGNKLIGVSRKQSWTRRDGERVSNSYRYYQCESRTNQSVCGYHTRRAEGLEADVRQAIAAELQRAGGDVSADDGAAAVAESQRDLERLRSRLRAIDRRLERYVDAASKGRIAKDKMRSLSVRAAADRLAVEDAIEAAEQAGERSADVNEAREARRRAATQLVDTWDELPFAERFSGLRGAISTITVSDDGVQVTLRS